MPKKSSKEADVKINLSSNGVAAVDKALGILKLFTAKKPELTLMDISEETGLYKSTVLRLLASLEYASLVIKQANNKYTLGPSIGRLSTAYQPHQTLENILVPELEKLMKATNESAAFHIRQGDQRLCLFRVDSNQALRDHIKVGDLLPIDKGAGGKVLRAFEGANDKVSADIRKNKVLALSGDRVKEISGISAPVFGPQGLIGVITLTMPTYRLNTKHIPMVKSSAKRLSEMLGGDFS